jgi:hypothetical protein
MRFIILVIICITLTACVGIPDSDGFFGIPGI